MENGEFVYRRCSLFSPLYFFLNDLHDQFCSKGQKGMEEEWRMENGEWRMENLYIAVVRRFRRFTISLMIFMTSFVQKVKKE